MPHLITPITLQGVTGYDLTYIDEQDGTGPQAWTYSTPFTACCQSVSGVNVFPGTTARLYQSDNHPGYEVAAVLDVNNDLECTVLYNNGTNEGNILSGSIQFGICCASYAYMTMRGRMRSQVAYEGDDWCEVYVNGTLAWSHAASNSEGQAYWNAQAGDPTLADNDFQSYDYEENITLTLDPSRACGNVIEIRSSSGSATISQAEIDASPGCIWNGVYWKGTLTSLA